MKASTEFVTFDHISTREELKQVLDLLSDANGAPNLEILDLSDMSATPEIDVDEDWAEPAGTENSQAFELANLANLFLRKNQRTN